MADVEKIIENGRSMGLMPRRHSISIGSHNKEWQNVRADEVKPGDIVAEHGLVDTNDDAGDGIHVQIRAGVDGVDKPVVLPRAHMVRVFR